MENSEINRDMSNKNLDSLYDNLSSNNHNINKNFNYNNHMVS